MTFQRNIPPPSSGSKNKPSKKPAEAGLKQVYFLTLKMKVMCSSKTLGCSQTAWHYNPEDRGGHRHCREKPKSNFINWFTKSYSCYLQAVLFIYSCMIMHSQKRLGTPAFHALGPQLMPNISPVG
jgi:hypothetical protein